MRTATERSAGERLIDHARLPCVALATAGRTGDSKPTAAATPTAVKPTAATSTAAKPTAATSTAFPCAEHVHRRERDQLFGSRHCRRAVLHRLRSASDLQGMRHVW